MHSARVGAPRAHARSRDAVLVCVAGAFRAAAVSPGTSILAHVRQRYQERDPACRGAVGPLVGGMAMQDLALAAPLLIGGTPKMVYDLALYRSFRHLRPPEEQVEVATANLQRTMQVLTCSG